jgi:chemotaxis signal transduction protein
MTWVRSIQRVDQLTRAVRDDGAIGWLPLGNQRVPVWALAERLGETAVSDSSSQRVIMLNDPTHSWGLLVDRVSQVQTAVSDDVHLVPSVALNPAKPYFDRVIRQGENMLLLLSPECLHPESECLRVASMMSSGWGKSGNYQLPTSKKEDEQAVVGKDKRGQIVIFQLPEQERDTSLSFLLSISQVPEILEPLPLLPVSGTEEHVVGIVNWRNRPVPIVELGQRFGLEKGRRRGGNGRLRLMIVRVPGNEELLGFMVQPNTRVVHLPIPYKSCPLPDSLPPELVLGSLRSDEDELLVIPNLSNLV